MKIHLQTKRGLNTLKFGACSEILALFLRGKLEIRVKCVLLSTEPIRELRCHYLVT